MTTYPNENLDDGQWPQDNGTMVESRDDLAAAVVGHRIVSAERRAVKSRWGSAGEGLVLTLDNGRRVILREEGDCCAYTDIEDFLLHPEMVDHVITGVGTTDRFQTWHIYADMGDVLELKVGWSCGNPFYYAYGFDITVEDL